MRTNIRHLYAQKDDNNLTFRGERSGGGGLKVFSHIFLDNEIASNYETCKLPVIA